jgi:hypothetical protein
MGIPNRLKKSQRGGEANESMPANPESCALLRTIVRRSPNAAGRIHGLAASVQDWDSLILLARGHGMSSMLYLRLAGIGPAVPQAAQEQLRSEYERNVFHNLANAAELIATLQAFAREAIPAMPFKGVVLGASAYGDLTTRLAGDLDVLIDERHLSRAAALLLAKGYELKTPVSPDGMPESPENFEYHFERQSDGMVIELRWRFDITQPRFRRNLGMDWVWPRRRTTILAGAEVPNLDPESTMLVLCMHGCKHAWSRLIWINDVAQVLSSFPGLDWKQLTREARRSGLWRPLALGTLLAHWMADAPVPQTVLRRFESDAAARSMAQHFQESLFDAPGSLPIGSKPYNIQLLGFRDRLRFFLSLDFLRPNARDRAVLRLPKSLDALYYLVRPIRLLWDRSAR